MPNILSILFCLFCVLSSFSATVPEFPFDTIVVFPNHSSNGTIHISKYNLDIHFEGIESASCPATGYLRVNEQAVYNNIYYRSFNIIEYYRCYCGVCGPNHVSFKYDSVEFLFPDQHLFMRIDSVSPHDTTIDFALCTTSFYIRLDTLSLYSSIEISLRNSSLPTLSIQPNPCNFVSNIHYNTNAQLATLSIFNATGQLMGTSNIKGSGAISLNTRHFPTGIYLCLLKLPNSRMISRKLIVMN